MKSFFITIFLLFLGFTSLATEASTQAAEDTAILKQGLKDTIVDLKMILSKLEYCKEAMSNYEVEGPFIIPLPGPDLPVTKQKQAEVNVKNELESIVSALDNFIQKLEDLRNEVDDLESTLKGDKGVWDKIWGKDGQAGKLVLKLSTKLDERSNELEQIREEVEKCEDGMDDYDKKSDGGIDVEDKLDDIESQLEDLVDDLKDMAEDAESISDDIE